MRVLLFVEGAGDKRPKCVHPNVPEYIRRRNGERIRSARSIQPASLSDFVLRMSWGLWAVEVRNADRWWLVECENAAAGRFMIAPSSKCPWPLPEGRILASGGREA